MNSDSQTEARRFVAKAMERLKSAAGRKALREVNARSRVASEPFKRARNISSEKLNRRFTV